MTAYLVTEYSVVGDHDAVIAALATKIETVDDTKTIRHISVAPRGNEFAGFLIYDT